MSKAEPKSNKLAIYVILAFLGFYVLVEAIKIYDNYTIASFREEHGYNDNLDDGKSNKGLPGTYLGAYSGIQPAYANVLQDNGAKSVVGTSPESVFTFCLSTQNRVV